MLWDVMTAAVMVHPELCPTKALRLEVNTSPGDHYGQTVVIGTGEPNTQVCLKPDADGIRERLRSGVWGVAPTLHPPPSIGGGPGTGEPNTQVCLKSRCGWDQGEAEEGPR